MGKSAQERVKDIRPNAVALRSLPSAPMEVWVFDCGDKYDSYERLGRGTLDELGGRDAGYKLKNVEILAWRRALAFLETLME